MKVLYLVWTFAFPSLLFSQIVDTSKVIWTVDSLTFLSEQFRRAGGHEAAFILAQDARDAAIVLGENHPKYAWSLNMLAVSNTVLNNYDKALTLYTDAKTIYEKTIGKNNGDYASIINNQAILYQRMGQYETAESLFIDAKELRRAIHGEEDQNYANALYGLSRINSAMGRGERFENLMLEAIKVTKIASGKNNFYYSTMLVNLASHYFSIGRYGEADDLYNEARPIFEKSSKRNPSYAFFLGDYAGFNNQLGREKKAKALYLDANQLIKEIYGTQHLSYAGNLYSLATIHFKNGEITLADSLLMEGTSIFAHFKDKHAPYVQSLLYRASFNRQKGNLTEAESILREAEKIAEDSLGVTHSLYANILGSLGVVYLNMKDFGQAERYLKQSTDQLAVIFGKEHVAYLKGIYNLVDLFVMTENGTELAVVAAEASDLARSSLLNSAQFLSEKELGSYRNTFRDYYHRELSHAQDLAQSDTVFPALCFNSTLFYKGFLLSTSKSLNDLVILDTSNHESYTLLKSYRYLLAKAYAKPIAEREHVAEWEAKANELEKELIQTVAGFGEALRQVSWQDVQAQLQPGEIAVEFVDYRSYDPESTDSTFYGALILRPGDEAPQFVPLFEENAIAPLLESASGRSMRNINNFYNFQKRAFGEQLYQFIWQPLEKYLAGTKKVYCSPAGLLHRINLGAVPINSTSVFADRHPLVTLGSTRQLVISTQAEVNKDAAFVLGGIKYDTDTVALAKSRRLEVPLLETSLPDALTFQSMPTDLSRGENLKYLPNTLHEAIEISTILQAQGHTVQLDTAYYATEEAFRQLGKDGPSPRVLHLATHGYFSPDPETGGKDTLAFKTSSHPMIRSGLLLAGSEQAYTSGKGPDNREDGVLTAYEISQMDLSNTELVVLSACETGLGDIDGNEGVYGLQRAFKIAGAKYLIMSLWQVGDSSSRQLMVEFYRQWLENGLTIPEAFWAAQQHLRSQFPDSPFQWAGFVLVE